MGNSWPNYRCQQSRPSLASAIGAFLVAQILVVSWLPRICTAQHAPAGAGLVGVLDLGRMGVGDTGEATRVEGLEVTVGFGGVWKLGQVLPVHVQGPSLSNPTARYLVAKTFDGDGVEVLYRRELAESEREAADSWFSISRRKAGPKAEH